MLAWLQKGTKRTHVPEPDTSTEVQVQPETSGTIHELQTNVNVDVSGTASVNEESAATNLNVTLVNDTDVNNNVSNETHGWPDCWSRDQIMYFCSTNSWLIFKDNKLGCKTCSSNPSLAGQKERGLKLSRECRACLIQAFGTDKAKQQLSLRKKFKDHRDLKTHIKAAKIAEMAFHNEFSRQVQSMHRHTHTQLV